MSLVFVPLSPAGLESLASSGTLGGPVTAVTATPTMIEAFGLPGATDEETEYTCLCIASLVGLVDHGRRLVAVATDSAMPDGEPSEFGLVELSGVSWSRVEAVFAEGAGRDQVMAVRAVLGERGLPELWEDQVVSDFLAAGELAWYAPEEWAQTITG